MLTRSDWAAVAPGVFVAAFLARIVFDRPGIRCGILDIVHWMGSLVRTISPQHLQGRVKPRTIAMRLSRLLGCTQAPERTCCRAAAPGTCIACYQCSPMTFATECARLQIAPRAKGQLLRTRLRRAGHGAPPAASRPSVRAPLVSRHLVHHD